MPTDHSLDSATATTRRSFLARAAVGGALVTAGAVAAGPVSGLLPAASAQEAGTWTLTDADFATFAAPLELAAVQAYQAAIDAGTLDSTWTTTVRTMQDHHQQVATLLAGLLSADANPPVADPDLAASATKAVTTGGDQNGILRALGDLENTLVATHLSAVPSFREPTTAKTVTAVLAVEAQHNALLVTGSGGTLQSATPDVESTDGALKPSASTTTTTTAAN